MLSNGTYAVDPLLFSAVLFLHFVGDFILQTDRMALNKSKSNTWLTAHIGAYSILITIVFGPVYAAVNAILHFCTDYVTSRITSYLWKKEERHWFFVTIGADQLIHALCLLWTLGLVWYGFR